jgi:hypothetical protein
MIRTRLGLLGLCVVLLGAMAFSASVAQAEVGAQWLFAEKGAGTESVPFLEASLGFEAETVLIIHTANEGKNILIECKSISTENATLKASGSIGKGAKIKIGGCGIKLNGVLQPECEPIAGKEKGVIRTTGLHALLELRELLGGGGVKDSVLNFSPDASSTWAVIEMSSGCPLGTKLEVFGNLAVKDCKSEFSTFFVKHLFEYIEAFTSLWIVKNNLEHHLYFLSSWWGFLTGAHEGLKWSGLPA